MSRQSRLVTLVFPGKKGGFAAEIVGFELGARWFEARGLLEWGESAYQPIQKLTGPKLADTRVSIQNTRYQRKTRRFLIEQSACVRSYRRRNGNQMNAISKLRTIASDKLDGVVYATSYLSDSRTTICVYGDPPGLRSLACKLLQLADLNQSELDGRSCPNSEGVHVHLDQSMGIHLSSCQLIVGRSDAKGTGDDRWITGSCDPAINI